MNIVIIWVKCIIFQPVSEGCVLYMRTKYQFFFWSHALSIFHMSIMTISKLYLHTHTHLFYSLYLYSRIYSQYIINFKNKLQNIALVILTHILIEFLLLSPLQDNSTGLLLLINNLLLGNYLPDENTQTSFTCEWLTFSILLVICLITYHIPFINNIWKT